MHCFSPYDGLYFFLCVLSFRFYISRYLERGPSFLLSLFYNSLLCNTQSVAHVDLSLLIDEDVACNANVRQSEGNRRRKRCKDGILLGSAWIRSKSTVFISSDL